MEKKSSKGKKVLFVFGLVLLILSVFLGSFALSIKIMANPSAAYAEKESQLNAENQQLKEDVQMLTDHNEVLSSELDKYKSKYGNISSSSSSKKSSDDKDDDSGRSRSSGDNDDEDEE